LEKARVMRNAYAIEYDCINPLSLKPTLEFLDRDGLFAAGQFNGTSGYEEAAAQGLVAGINAAHRALGKPSFILPRSSSYIGTLIDDLVTKGCEDPYRMMTSRSEYRLVLRQDNADLRLTEKGFRLGLISKKKYNEVKKKAALIEEEIRRAKRTTIAPNEKLNAVLAAHGTAAVDTGVKLSELLKRPQLSYEILRPFDEACPRLSRDIIEQAEIAIKYEGYIKRQEAAIAEAQRLENRKLPEDIDYTKIKGLRLEAAEKLSRIRPENVGQASRISGVSPCDISVLLIFLRKK
ncbi:MAG TPA: FAD-dependent oxidoreductase, partial [Clostridiales bacterium]|nr:FAD-dependent oxidoreductase [Clostridiales bacterium]